MVFLSGQNNNEQLPSNEDVLKIWKETKSADSIQKNLAAQFPSSNWESCDKYVLHTKISRLNSKRAKLSKTRKNSELNSFMKSSFEIPDSKYNVGETIEKSVNQDLQKKIDTIKTSTSALLNENLLLRKDIDDVLEENENYSYQVKEAEHKIEILENLLELANEKYRTICMQKKESDKIRKELQVWEKKYENLSKQFEDAADELHQKKLKLQKESTRNLNKKIKRRDEKLSVCYDSLKESVRVNREKERELEEVRRENENVKSEVSGLKKEKRNLLLRVNRLKASKRDFYEENLAKITTLKLEVAEKDEKIKNLEQMNALISDPVIESFYDGKYSDQVRQTVMTLITECGVSQKKVNSVMETVVKNLTGKTLSRLPSVGVRNRLILEAKRVANQQLAKTLLEDKPVTLHQDGTSKFHKHFQSFQISNSDGTTMSAGLHEVGKSDANKLFETFQVLISDLAETIKTGNQDEKVAALVKSIVATMSDQGSVNPLFNDKFQVFREDLLPLAYDRWDEMSDNERKSLGEVFNFFCKMHIFVNMATEVDKSLMQFEKTVISEGHNPFAFSTAESGSSRLVRTASKALTAYGCEKSGVGGHFLTYLQDKGLQNKLITFRGHRFNHLFYAAGATFYHLRDIQDFIKKWADPNDLLKSVAFDSKEPVYIAGIRALGLIDKIITGPLWRIIETVPCVLSLNTYLHQLKLNLESWSKDASPLLSGETVFGESESEIHKDCIYEALTAPSEDPMTEAYTQMALEICLGSMLIILERQAKDQLPGGKYWNLESSKVQLLSSVPTTNTVSERDFAQLDMLMRAKPNASTVTFESIIMWSNNKTSDWLSSLSEDERCQVLSEARTSAPNMLQNIKARQRQLFTCKLENLRQRQEKKAKQEEKTHANKVKLTQKLTELGGLWLTVDQIDQYCESCESDFKIRDAVVTQLQFRKSVLNSKGSKHLFQQSSKGKTFCVQEMINNLKAVIEINQDENMPECVEPKLFYKNTEEARNEIQYLKRSLNQKIEENRKKILITQQKDLLPNFLSNPNTLVGKRVKHKCRDPVTKIVEWFTGTVKNIQCQNENPFKIEFNIHYDDDNDDDDWCFPLLKDMQNGDVIIT